MYIGGIIVVIVVIQTALATDLMPLQQKSSLTSMTDNNTHFDSSCLEFTPQSCSGVCGQSFDLWCSCDEYCQVYERCCFDYQTVCKEDSEKARRDHKNLMNVTIECESDIAENYIPQQIITSCSTTNISATTVELCETETKSSAVVSKVMSRRTKLHYKNRYCMLCNGEEEDDVVYWSTMVGMISQKLKPESIENILKYFQNSLKIIPPPNFTEITCFPKIISSCMSSATPEKKRLCEENALSPLSYYRKVYKNTFCLQCADGLHDKRCYPAQRRDMFQIKDPFSFSMIFNWEKKRESSVSIDTDISKIGGVACSLDKNDDLKECKITKCVGTLPVTNGTCQIGPDTFGCIQYIFQINFTLPENSTSDGILKYISLALVQFATTLERVYNVTKYYSQNVELHNIKLYNNQIQGFVYLERMAYNLCYLDFKGVSYKEYFEYLDTNLVVNLNGSISTCRYTVNCYKWCAVSADRRGRQKLCPLHMKYFTENIRNIEMDSDLTSNATKVTLIYIYILSLIVISEMI